MNLTDLVGSRMTVEKRITPSMTASHVGSGGVDVLATPVMILLFEQTARDAVQASLPRGFTTVGTRVDVEHVSATPLGELVTVTVELTEVDGRSLTYRVEAKDEHSRIGGGTHTRHVVDLDRFMNHLKNRNQR